MNLMKIISGGQTGVDQAALQAAKEFGLKTGGFMPKGFRTQAGDNPLLARTYGLHETKSREYPPRTLKNVLEADATLILGYPTSRGCRFTIKCCEANKKTYITVRKEATDLMTREHVIKELVAWIRYNNVKIVNVAGNREESHPGIGEWARLLLVEAFCELRHSE